MWKGQFSQTYHALGSAKIGQSFHVGRWALNYYQSLDRAQDSLELPEEVEKLKKVIAQNDTQIHGLEVTLALTKDDLKALSIQVETLTRRNEELEQKNEEKNGKLSKLRARNRNLRQRIKIIYEENEKLISEVERLSVGFSHRVKRVLRRYFLPSEREK